jgi:hypothetical protein
MLCIVIVYEYSLPLRYMYPRAAVEAKQRDRTDMTISLSH